MKKTLLIAAIAFSLAACQESPDKTARDVAEARREGAENVREAERERERTVGQARTDASDRADADYELAEARAKAALDVEQERCEGMASDMRSACKDNAKAVYDQAIAEADRQRAMARRDNRDPRTNP